MAYSKILAIKYAANRNYYRSSDRFLVPFLERIKIKGKVILDFGCGDGPEAQAFLEMGAKKVVGVDNSAEMIRLAKLRGLVDADFKHTRNTTLPMKDATFDVIYSRFVLHYIKNLESQLLEISRVLKPRGYFLALFQCLTDNPKLLNIQVPINIGRGGEVTKIKILSKSTDEIQNALRNANLKKIKLIKVKNTDSYIDPEYNNKHHLKNGTYILFAQKQ